MPTDNINGSNGRFSPDIYFDEVEHIYMVDGKNVPSVTEILAPLHRGYNKVNPSVLEYAANRGKAVHSELEVFDLGGELEATQETAPYIQAYLEWEQVYRPTWIGVEKIVCHFAPEIVETEDGADLKAVPDYIGTLDRIGYFNEGDVLNIVDIKTSQPTKEALISVCAQTYAYAEAYDETRANKIERWALFLKKDGTWRFQNCEEYEEKNGFPGSGVWWQLLETHKMITKLLETKGKKNNG